MTHSTPSLSVALPAADDEDVRQQVALIKSLLVTVQHFFGGFNRLFGSVADPRHPAYITYPLPSVLTTGALLFLLRLGARRQVNLRLRQNGPSSAKFQALFGVGTCPHGDTLDTAYQRLSVPEVQDVVTATVETLIRQKVLYRYRLCERYFLVTIDGTGTLTFSERHCPHCLTMTHHGHTTYYHPILEAKLVTRDGFVFSLMTEFIENPSQHPTKQDCELKAFYRLADRLKQRFPRLPICLLLDSLFAGGPTFSICQQYRWQYLVVLREADLPSVQTEFNALLDYAPQNHLRFQPADQYQTVQDFDWVNDIQYVDSENTPLPSPSSAAWKRNRIPRQNSKRRASSGSPTCASNPPTSSNCPTKEVVYAGRSKTKALTCRRMGAMRWHTSSPTTWFRPRYSTCCCNSRIR